MTHVDCLHCGYEYADHRQDDLRCPRVKPYIAGVVNVRDYESETTYTERKEDEAKQV